MTLEYFILNFGPALVLAVGIIGGGAVLVFGIGRTEKSATHDMVERSRSLTTGQLPTKVVKLGDKNKE